ncbi:uncharacterized protein N0V96_000464 [Colletotrichum fioriniae]|uniref:uncharacterized protein n=1 Tax=Colletotrichum fioriniae TaxID=710243 RepID=UPI002301732E|nr:uncharacterized protein COL516b_006510 [Colletotrichum fioriniae]KAJ0303505.1 hypothetical protein COL516b_006510 [Colletotrichum fioriniae]KAJ3949349.1 hypothetical protein N0V96_000464 [Colletotrichum fioriniae]
MDANKINWKDAFLFFYWDLHDEDTDSPLASKAKYDNFIMEFLKGERLPLNTLSRPKSWNHLLWHLMRSSLYQTGNSRSNYNWLYDSPSETEEPWVNWMELLDIYSEQVEFDERNEYDDHIFWVLEYLEERAYANVHCNLTMNEAWASNPYLLGFGDFQGLRLDWAVSLPFNGASSYELGLPLILDQGFIINHEVASNAIHLHYDRDRLGNRKLLGAAQFYYTSMIRWAKYMAGRGRVSSIGNFFLRHSEFRHWPKLDNAADRLRITKELWESIRR